MKKWQLVLATALCLSSLIGCSDDEPAPSGNDGGQTMTTWTPLGSPSNIPNILSIIQLGQTQMVYTSAGMYVSRNGGNWSSATIAPTNVVGMVASGNAIYVNENYSLYRSTNNGETWNVSAFSNYLSSQPVINGNAIYVGSYGGVYRSTNNGASWRLINQGHSGYVYGLAFNGSTYYAIVNYNRLFRSASSDSEWVETGFPASTSALNNSLIAVGSSILIGTYTGIARSTDNGATWSVQTTNQIYATRFRAFGSTIYACSYQGLYRSNDSGATWTQVGNKTNISDVSVSGTTITIATSSEGVLHSTNDGATWTRQNAGFPSQYVERACGVGTTVFATTSFPVEELSKVNRQTQGGGGSNNLYRTTNNGQQWSLAKITFNDGSSIDTVSYASDMLTVGNALFVGNNYGLFRTTDKGNSWSRDTASFLRSNGVRYLNQSGNALFAIYYGGFGRSTNNGATWTEFTFNPYGGSALISSGKQALSGARATSSASLGGTALQVAQSGSTIFVASTDGLYRTTNGGSTWSKVISTSTQSQSDVATIGSTVFYPLQDKVLYSSDNGDTWAESRVGARYHYVRLIAATGNILFAGTDNGLYVSKDSGRTWQTTGLIDVSVESISFDGNSIYAATRSGIYKSAF